MKWKNHPFVNIPFWAWIAALVALVAATAMLKIVYTCNAREENKKWERKQKKKKWYNARQCWEENAGVELWWRWRPFWLVFSVLFSSVAAHIYYFVLTHFYSVLFSFNNDSVMYRTKRDQVTTSFSYCISSSYESK